jgi:hypothetical protein
MNISQSASSIAIQVMQQPSSLANGTPASSQRAALALVEAEVATAPQVSSNGMVGGIINTFA